jgi:tRNA pseudouridine38-40 synthase
MPVIQLLVEYDGTGFSGWQYQENGRSVQNELEKSLRQILQIEIRVTGAGRTDTGVHARGQVASCEIKTDFDERSLLKSLNAVLPEDVVVKNIRKAPDDFNARYSAKSRRYRYFIKRVPAAVGRNYCWQLFHDLDIRPMKQCAEKIMGEHDFTSFCKNGSETEHNRCIINSASWEEDRNDLVFEISANRFLYGMVRTLVGTMVEVGKGKISVGEFVGIMDKKDRSAAGKAAPAKGLFLEEICY